MFLSLSKTPSSRKARVLTVDDDPRVTLLVQLCLQATGRYQVWMENRSMWALETARQVEPDLIILDLEMPGKDGGDLACELLSHPRLGVVPILFLSSHLTEEEVQQRSGSTRDVHFMAKPVDLKLLAAKLDSILDGRKQPHANAPEPLLGAGH